MCSFIPREAHRPLNVHCAPWRASLGVHRPCRRVLSLSLGRSAPTLAFSRLGGRRAWRPSRTCRPWIGGHQRQDANVGMHSCHARACISGVIWRDAIQRIKAHSAQQPDAQLDREPQPRDYKVQQNIDIFITSAKRRWKQDSRPPALRIRGFEPMTNFPPFSSQCTKCTKLR